MTSASRTLAEWRDFSGPWQRPPFDRVREIDRVVTALHVLADVSASPSSQHDNLFFDLDGVRRESGRCLSPGIDHDTSNRLI